MNPFSKKGLGRGLSSLIGDMPSTKTRSNKVLIGNLKPNKNQPRKQFDEVSLNELSESIKEKGIIQPIIVRPLGSSNYEIIAGERRWLAAQKASLHEVPVVIVDADDLKSLEFAIIENVQRHDLNSIDEAQSYQKLIDEFGYDQEKVSKFIGKSRAYITNSLRLLTLPEDVLGLIRNNKLTPGHAKILVGTNNSYHLAKKIINKKLSVRQTENLVRILKSNKKKNLTYIRDPNLHNLENLISEKTGLNVKIKNNKKNHGSIAIDFKSLDQLNRLIDVIKSYY